MERETFTWIGPFSETSSAGSTARDFARGLSTTGHATGMLDTGPGDHPHERADDGPVRWIGTTVVRHAPLSRIGTTAAILALDARARQMAYVVADVERLTPDMRAVLDRCDEVWAPSTFQLEILCTLGIERARLHVVAPGCTPYDGPGMSKRKSENTRMLCVGGDAPRLTDGITCERAVSRPGTAEFAADVARADLVVVLADVCPWGSVALEVLHQGRPLAYVESGIAAEFAGDDDCDWITAACARDPRLLAEHVSALLADRNMLSRRAARARARIERDESLAAASARLIARRSRARVLPEPRLARALSDLGLPTPLERLAGSRAKVLIVPVPEFAGTWREALRQQVADIRPDPEATVCLWVDETCAADMDRIAEAAEAEIARCGATDHDVLVVLAPLSHAPRERLVTSIA
jgi:hypothetical protein